MNEEQEIYTAHSPDLQVGDVVHFGDAVVDVIDNVGEPYCIKLQGGTYVWIEREELHGLQITRKPPSRITVTGTLVQRIERDGKKMVLVEVEE